eukprot:1725300-Alexandrium_andersonii.AAC.1
MEAYPPLFLAQPALPPASQAKALPVPAPPPLPPAQAAMPRLADRFTLQEYRQRLVAIYAVHKPENVEK